MVSFEGPFAPFYGFKFPSEPDGEKQRCSREYPHPWVMSNLHGDPVWFLLKIKRKLLMSWDCSRDRLKLSAETNREQDEG